MKNSGHYRQCPEGRTAGLKLRDGCKKAFEQLGSIRSNSELVDLKSGFTVFSGANPPMTGIYDQPKQQAWPITLPKATKLYFISPEYNHGYSPALKNALDYLGKEWQGKPAAYISYGGQPMVHVPSTKFAKSVLNSVWVDTNAVIEIEIFFHAIKPKIFEPNPLMREESKSSKLINSLNVSA